LTFVQHPVIATSRTPMRRKVSTASSASPMHDQPAKRLELVQAVDRLPGRAAIERRQLAAHLLDPLQHRFIEGP
jgi:hypothetical protein